MKVASASTYKCWTYGAYLCWKNRGHCDDCNQQCICDSIKPMALIPYGLKPMKFAVLKLTEKFGTEGLDERYNSFDNECDRDREPLWD